MNHGSNTALSREIFWDHRSDFGNHGHVWFQVNDILLESKVTRNACTGCSAVKTYTGLLLAGKVDLTQEVELLGTRYVIPFVSSLFVKPCSLQLHTILRNVLVGVVGFARRPVGDFERRAVDPAEGAGIAADTNQAYPHL